MLRTVAKICLVLASVTAFAQEPEFEDPRKPADRELIAKIYASMDSQKLYKMIAEADTTKTYSEGRDDIFKVTAKAVEYKQDDWSAKGAAVGISTTFRNDSGWDRMNVEVSDIGGKVQFTGLAEKGLYITERITAVGLLKQDLIETQAGIKEGLTSTGGELKMIGRMSKEVTVIGSGGAARVSDGNTVGRAYATVAYNPSPHVELALKYEAETNSKPTPDYYSPKLGQSITAAASAAAPFKNGWRAQGTVAVGYGMAKNAEFDPTKVITSEVTVSKPIALAEVSIVSPKLTVHKNLNPITISFNAGYSYDGARQGTGSVYSATSGYTGGYQKAYASIQVSIAI